VKLDGDVAEGYRPSLQRLAEPERRPPKLTRP
jgi:hypothetical protein